MSKLVGFNTKALEKIEAINTRNLDDLSKPRSEMATASEIAGCPRKTVLGMTSPATSDAKSLRQKRRGHIFEIDQTERFLAMGFTEVKPEEFKDAPAPCFCRQLTLENKQYSVGAHLDFCIKHRDGGLHVIECKTTGSIPEKPYPNWINQIHVQLGLLHEAFPGAPIRGSVLAVDLNRGEEEEFNGFTPNMDIYRFLCEDLGGHIIAAKKGEREPGCEIALYCGFCEFRADCPAFELPVVELPEEVQQAAQQHLAATAQKKAAEKTIEKAKSVIAEFAGDFFRGKVNDVEVDVITVAASKVVDSDKLKRERPELFQDETYLKDKAGYQKIEVRRFTPRKAAEKKAA